MPGDSKIDVIYLSSLFGDSRRISASCPEIGRVTLRNIGASNCFQRLRVSRVPRVGNRFRCLGFSISRVSKVLVYPGPASLILR